MPVYNPTENEFHGIVIKLVNCDGVEVAEESRGDWIASTPWRTHCSYQQNVHQIDLQPRRLDDNYLNAVLVCYSTKYCNTSTHVYNVLYYCKNDCEYIDVQSIVQSMNNQPSHLPKKIPTVQDMFRPIPGPISCAGVTRRWGLLPHAQNAVR